MLESSVPPSDSQASATLTRSTACPLDCPDACSLEAHVDAKTGKLVRIDAGPANPATRGFICSKVRHIDRYLNGPERLLHPARRVGPKGQGTFEPISWEEALERIAERLQHVRSTRGGEAILPYCYGGSNGLFTQGFADARLFRRIGASRLARTVCAAPSGTASLGLYGKMAGTAIGDYVHSQLIVLWGQNPSATSIHSVPLLHEAQKRGAKLVVIDPRKTPLAERADLHLAVRPGTDLALALGGICWLFAEGKADLAFLREHGTGWEKLRDRAASWTLARVAEVTTVPLSLIEAFVQLYAEASPAVIRCGWGPERNRNGGSAIAAILAMPAVGGKFGVRGGGYTMSNSGAYTLATESVVGAREPSTRMINMCLLGEELLTRRDPPIDALFVYNSNAWATSPEQNKVTRGLMREDLFTVVFDQVMTDTARYADVVLPATHFLEHEDLHRSYGSYALQRVLPVLEPPGEARSNDWVFRQLALHMGVSDPGDLPVEQALSPLLAASPDGERLHRELASVDRADPSCGAAPVQFVDLFPATHDRKIHFLPARLDAEAPLGMYVFQPEVLDPSHPLALLSASEHKTINSTFGHLREEAPSLEISNADAVARGISDGNVVRVHNHRGSLVCPVRINRGLPTGIVQFPKGVWARHTVNGSTANALAPDTLSDLGAGACFNDTRVQVCLAEPSGGTF